MAASVSVPDGLPPRFPRWDALQFAALERELCCDDDNGDGPAVLDAERLLRQRVREMEAAAARGNTGGAQDADAWHDLGAFLARRGNAAGAEECLREALRVQPAHGAALTACAALAAAGGRYDEACTLATAAAALDGAPAAPGHASIARSLLALAAHLNGELREGAGASAAAAPATAAGGGGGSGAAQEEGAGDSPCARVLRAGEEEADGVPAAQAARAALRLARYVLELGPAAGTVRDVAVERAAAACAVAPHTPATSHALTLLHARWTLSRPAVPPPGEEASQAAVERDAARAALQRVAEDSTEAALRAEAWYALSRQPGVGGGSDAHGASVEALRWATAGDNDVAGASAQDSADVAALVWRTHAPVWPVAAALQLAGALQRACECDDAPDSGRGAAVGAARAAYLRAADAWDVVAVGGKAATDAPPCWAVLVGLARLAAADGDVEGAAELMGRAASVEPRALLLATSEAGCEEA
jgi:tetratricopeptide (TPR) repeat protein